jgi:hypothetical protein
MTKQIFKNAVPNNLFYSFLEKICLKTDKYYFIDVASYNKLLFLDLKKPFIDALTEFYFLSKRFYLEREFTYSSFTNIVRQISKHECIKIDSEIKYSHSKYYINFFVHHN